MRDSNFRPKKRLGQSFLINQNISQKIIAASGLARNDIILEIGPGKGILTKELARRVSRVVAVEVDKRLYADLLKTLKDCVNVSLLKQDILKFDLKGYLKQESIINKIKIVANIPYSITTLILEYVFDNIDVLDSVYLMVQKEFAQRIVAKAGTKDYSSLSCFAQFHTFAKILFTVKRNCFWPQPKVDSCFIELKARSPESWIEDLRPKDEKLLFKLITGAFCYRRKTILNSLAYIIDKEKIAQILANLKIDPHLRPENLSIEQYIRISNEI